MIKTKTENTIQEIKINCCIGNGRTSMSTGWDYYVHFFQTATIILSIVLVWSSVDFFLEFGVILSDFSFTAVLILSVVASMTLMLFSLFEELFLLGLCPNGESLCELLTFQAVIIVIGTGIALLSYEQYFINVGENNLSNELEESILSYSLAVFAECCREDNPYPVDCSDELGAFPCFSNREVFNEYLSSVSDRQCSFLESKKLVSKTDYSSCGNQTIAPFVKQLMLYSAEETANFGKLNVVIGSILLFIVTIVTLVAYSLYEEHKPRIVHRGKDAGIKTITPQIVAKTMRAQCNIEFEAVLPLSLQDSVKKLILEQEEESEEEISEKKKGVENVVVIIDSDDESEEMVSAKAQHTEKGQKQDSQQEVEQKQDSDKENEEQVIFEASEEQKDREEANEETESNNESSEKVEANGEAKEQQTGSDTQKQE